MDWDFADASLHRGVIFYLTMTDLILLDHGIQDTAKMIEFNLLLALNVSFNCVWKEDDCWWAKRRKRCIAEQNYWDEWRTTYEAHKQLHRRQGILKNGTGQGFPLGQDVLYFHTFTWLLFFLFHRKSIEDYCHDKMAFTKRFLQVVHKDVFLYVLVYILFLCLVVRLIFLRFEIWIIKGERERDVVIK